MARIKALLMAAILAAMLALPLSVSAYNSGGVEASESQVAMIPSTGLNVGDSVTFYLTLTNTQQSEANNVGYAFYKNQYSSENKFVENVIDNVMLASNLETFNLSNVQPLNLSTF